jgi:hypothetical protein
MGKTVAMQPWVTIKNAVNGTFYVIQPAADWVNAENFTEAAINIFVAGATGSTANLCLETGAAPEGPWRQIGSSLSGTAVTVWYFTSREGGTDQFERFLRWKVGGTSGVWSRTFKLCATLK